ncbi:MAG: HU family DNA-binding protein [Acidobacteriota bacterium]|nr:HU family DNA-binding protein [Acidobacteriota bacterium]
MTPCLIHQLAESTQPSKHGAERLLVAVLTHIAEALGNGEKVDLRGFGSFQVSAKKERQGRNPRTGETLTIAAKRVASFKPSKEMADRVNAKTSASKEVTAP